MKPESSRHTGPGLCADGRWVPGVRPPSQERATNYALQAGTCEEVIRLLTDSLPPWPEYFGREVELNRQGAGRAQPASVTGTGAGA
jgi:hypothetical protein